MRRIVGIAVIALLVWWGMSKFTSNGDNKPKNGNGAVQISTALAVRRDIPITVSLVGNVIAYETVAIKSRLDSQISEVKFHDGDFVQKGQTLFVLDDRALKAQVAQDEAKAANAHLQYERSKKLLAGNYISQAQVDDNKAAYDAAKAALESSRVLLSYTNITAPISGRAGTINVTEGNNVKVSDVALVTINQISPIRAQFSIPERYYEQVKAALKQGDIEVTATREQSAASTKGNLEYIDNEINQSTGSFVARAIFANEQENLWPGMFANLLLNLGQQKDVLTIPAVAIQGDEGKHFVFKVENGKAVKTPVDASISGDYAVVTRGINENDTVITDGLLRVSDGASVEEKKAATEENNK